MLFTEETVRHFEYYSLRNSLFCFCPDILTYKIIEIIMLYFIETFIYSIKMLKYICNLYNNSTKKVISKRIQY